MTDGRLNMVNFPQFSVPRDRDHPHLPSLSRIWAEARSGTRRSQEHPHPWAGAWEYVLEKEADYSCLWLRKEDSSPARSSTYGQ